MVGQSETFDKALREVRERFLFDLDQRICDLEHLKSHIVNGPNGIEAVRAVAMMAHKIRGVAPTLGLAQLGGLAAVAEDLFSTAGKHPNLNEFWHVAGPVFEDLLDEMERVQPDYSTS
jgi:HPt (histidine-containing phosphotransfer) domain-containing protein